MRAIDALELKRSISVSAVIEDGKHIFDIIDDQPTIEPEPKTGYWTLYDKRFPWLHDYKCSQCGKRLSFSGLSGEAAFCPYCGAKMEGILNG